MIMVIKTGEDKNIYKRRVALDDVHRYLKEKDC
jgi:hypothetical protein